MSDEMAVGDNASNDEQKLDGGETETETMETADASELQAEPSAPEAEATSETTEDESAVETKDELKENLHETDLPIKEESETEEMTEEQKETDEEVTRGVKRRASAAFSDGGDEEFKGFDSCEQSSVADYSRIIEEERKVKRRTSTCSDDGFKGFDLTEHNSLTGYCQVLERLEAEVSAAIKTYKPVRSVMATPAIRASKRARQDTGGCTKWSENLEAEVTAFVRSFSDENGETVAAKRQRRGTGENDSSRPSSAQSWRSDGEGAGAGAEACLSPASRGGRRATAEMSAPALRVPLERGWRRELVYRAVGASADASSRRNADIYYYTPLGKKLRSTREVAEHLSGTGLTLENFSFFKEPLGIDDPEKEIIRDAKVIRRVESPVPAAPPPVLDGKRTPKPKPPKGASPEPATHKSPPAKLKVKSMGSRLSSNGTTTPKQAKKAPAPQQPPAQSPQPMPAPADNNNTAAWKKPSEAGKGLRARTLANGAASPPAAPAAPAQSPRRRGRPRADDADHFTAFHTRARAADYNVAVQIFQYLGMRDVARCARVCRLWRQLASAPALWRHVRMKNSHVSDWAGLCAALKSHGTRWLDLRKMLLPPNDTVFWDHFAEHIGSVDTLERLELCRCPARAVEAACERLPGLRALAAPAIRDARLDPAPLARLPRLELLRLKSLTGLSLTRDLHSLSSLSRLQHLSLTSIKELGWCACEVVGQLEQLESLELGECSFGGSFATALGKLVKLRRLRLERGVSHCAAPALLRALSALPKLTRLELVNFDVKVGFDDALAECKNIQRLLIIPTYVSQSATTNKQVLSGVLRLKDTLTHLMWGVTIELLRVTELFIDQCEAGEGEGKRRDVGECIPVLKPVPGCRLPDEQRTVAGPPQVEILPIPTLQRLLSAQLPNTKLKLLRIPFHATWRQSLADFQ
ncbi:uncharacterized protein LOC124540132 isoform X3 [Vanessa cardui]|uniref:uncharacterized protein LOC124540132 isoform X3 n=1 Tax=Vanessa cardui TaxID=171605 RepID=UPI001F12C4C0|nr:uncharacterized protein LOC124540132 isoform X3 [Vanessa cardui]